MQRRTFLIASASAVACGTHAEDGLVLALNEGVTYKGPGGGPSRLRDIGEDLSRVLKQPVRVQAVSDYTELAAGLAAQKYQLAYVHPAHHSIRAMSKNGYRLVAVTKGFTEYKASFMVAASSKAQSLADLKGQKVGAPDEDSITSVLTRATLRDALGGQLPAMQYVRLQEAVPFMVENNMVAAGVSASRAVVQAWEKKGGRVLAASKPVPIKHMLALRTVPDATREALGQYLLGMDQSPDGRKRLENLNVQGFVPYDEAALVGMGKWLGV